MLFLEDKFDSMFKGNSTHLQKKSKGKIKADSNFHAKLQSAMEYLMTYGWAILIIAVVLGALFSLGVFNSANLAPRALWWLPCFPTQRSRDNI